MMDRRPLTTTGQEKREDVGPRSSTDGNSILVIDVAGIGDFVDSTAALKALRYTRMDAHITLLVAEKVRPLALLCPFVDEVIALPTAPGRGVPPLAATPRWIRNVYPLRGRFSLVVNLYEVSTSLGSWWLRLLLAWIKAPISVGQNTQGRAPYLTWSLSDDHTPKDNISVLLKVVSLLPGSRSVARASGEERRNRPELCLPPEVIASTREWIGGLSQWGSLNGPYVVIALGGERRTRHERPDRAGQWLRRLQEEFAIRPIIWGTLSDPLPSAGQGLRYVDARGQCDLVHAAALIACADVVIATQSAAQHLSGIWGIPSIILAGPADPERHRPHLPPERLRILYRSVPCSPCFHDDCPWSGRDYQHCMHHISPDHVVDAFRAIVHADHFEHMPIRVSRGAGSTSEDEADQR